MRADRRQFAPGDDEGAAREDDLHGVRRNTGQIHQDLDGAWRLDDVDRRAALAGGAGLPLDVEFVQQPPRVFAELADIHEQARH